MKSQAKTGTKSRRSDCPINFALELLGDKWSLLVIRDLVFAQKCHFRDLLKSPEKIATNILTDRLKRLEASGIITRQPHPDSGREVIYHLTPKGIDLIPMLVEMIRWGGKYDQHTAAEDNYLQRIEQEREMLIKEIAAGLDK